MARKKKPQELKRPYATHYFKEVDSKDPDIVQGHSKTPKGAVRGSVVRIFMGDYVKAVIIDKLTGAALYTVMFGAKGLQVLYGSSSAKPQAARRVNTT